MENLLAGLAAYHEATGIVAQIMLAHLIYGAVNIIDAGIAFSRKTTLYVYTFGACVPLNFGLNYVLIPRFGSAGAAWAALATFTTLVALTFTVSNRLFRLEVDFARLGRMLLATLGAIAVAQWVQSLRTPSAVLPKCLMFCLYLSVVMMWVLDATERGRLLRLTARLLHRTS